MLSKLLEAFKSLYNSLFGKGGSTKKNDKKPSKTIDEELLFPQDGSEITPETVVVTSNEMEPVEIVPGNADKGFDENIFAGTDAEPPSSIPVIIDPPISEPVVDPGGLSEAEAPQAPETPKGRFLWCLDNGHGKKTAGKRSPVFDDKKTQLVEYEFNRDIVRRIMASLDQQNLFYFNVVPEVDVDDLLKERVARANNYSTDLPKLYVSIHANAAPARSGKHWGPDSISGIETWHYHGSKRGQKMAAIFQRHLIEKMKFRNRHLKSRPENQFYVLRKTKMTAILTENGFYNNKKEALNLMKDDIRQKIADAHVAAILEIEKKGL